MNHEWQSESIDGPKVVGVAFFGVAVEVAVVTSHTTAGCSVV